MERPMDWQADDLLSSAVLARLDADTRAKVLPLVCRRFHQLLRRPGACWQELAYTAHSSDDLETLRLHGFLAWAIPRAGALQNLRLEVLPALHEDAGHGLIVAIVALLQVAAASLWRLELRTHHTAPMHLLLPKRLQQGMGQLLELQVVSADNIAGVLLDRLPRLQRLTIITDSEYPQSLDALSTLPGSVTRVVLTPAPMTVVEDGQFPSKLPRCLLELPNLRFLDISGSLNLVGLADDLPHLTAVTGLALDHCNLPSLPHQLLSLHGSLWPLALAQGLDYSPLSALPDLRVLSISDCRHLRVLPPSVARMAQLKALHLEKTAITELPEDLQWHHLQTLSIDWAVLLSSHHVLARLTQLHQLLLGSMELEEEEAEEQKDEERPPVDTAAVVASLRRCPKLRTVSIVIYPGAPLNLRVAALMLQLPRSSPQLQVEALDASSFFLTGCEALAAQD